jgi:hypothetical protein
MDNIPYLTQPETAQDQYIKVEHGPVEINRKGPIETPSVKLQYGKDKMYRAMPDVEDSE